jgi:hypothetical protein
MMEPTLAAEILWYILCVVNETLILQCCSTPLQGPIIIMVLSQSQCFYC